MVIPVPLQERTSQKLITVRWSQIEEQSQVSVTEASPGGCSRSIRIKNSSHRCGLNIKIMYSRFKFMRTSGKHTKTKKPELPKIIDILLA